MHDLLHLTFEQSPCRIIMLDGEPWFASIDVADILGYSHGPHMVRMLDDDEQGVHKVDGLEGHRTVNREITIISESGLYLVIFNSKKPEAKAFRRWVTGTVLPEIRRSGSYNGHSNALHGPLAALPAMLDGKTAVQLRDVAAALSFHGDADSLVYLAGIMRSTGWRKAWVRADTVEPVNALPRQNQLLLGKGDIS